jgi:hypothetical protein
MTPMTDDDIRDARDAFEAVAHRGDLDYLDALYRWYQRMLSEIEAARAHPTPTHRGP